MTFITRHLGLMYGLWECWVAQVELMYDFSPHSNIVDVADYSLLSTTDSGVLVEFRRQYK